MLLCCAARARGGVGVDDIAQCRAQYGGGKKKRTSGGELPRDPRPAVRAAQPPPWDPDSQEVAAAAAADAGPEAHGGDELRDGGDRGSHASSGLHTPLRRTGSAGVSLKTLGRTPDEAPRPAGPSPVASAPAEREGAGDDEGVDSVPDVLSLGSLGEKEPPDELELDLDLDAADDDDQPACDELPAAAPQEPPVAVAATTPSKSLPVTEATNQRPSQVFAGLTFVVTGVKDAREAVVTEAAARSAGGRVLVDLEAAILKPDLGTVEAMGTFVVVADCTTKSLKFLSGLAVSAPIVTRAWVHDCVQRQTLLPTAPYAVPSCPARDDGLAGAPADRRLFSGRAFLVVGSDSFRHRSAWVLRAAGAAVCEKPPADYVLSDGTRAPASAAKIRVVSTAWVAECLMVQAILPT
jgi:hypothetical protein